MPRHIHQVSFLQNRDRHLKQMVQERLSNRHGFPVTEAITATLFVEWSEEINRLTLCEEGLVTGGLGVCLCTDVSLLSGGQGRVTQISVICLLTQLYWNTQHHPHLSSGCIPTSVLWLKYHCFPHKHLLKAKDVACQRLCSQMSPPAGVTALNPQR